jgi:hypothetical protein
MIICTCSCCWCWSLDDRKCSVSWLRSPIWRLTLICEKRADVSAIEGCYGYDKAEHYQNNNVTEQVGSELSQNPQRRKQKRKVYKKPAQGSKAQLNYVNGRLSNVDMDKIHGVTNVVGGYIQVSSIQVFALFDHSASHSFISTDMVETCKMVKSPMRRPLLVQTPVREIQAD